jgi:hypothetical protein
MGRTNLDIVTSSAQTNSASKTRDSSAHDTYGETRRWSRSITHDCNTEKKLFGSYLDGVKGSGLYNNSNFASAPVVA